jgi:exopolysaccharide biosynthesis WecB/TagA/CpsF family protein
MKVQEKLLIDIFFHLPEEQKVVGLGVGASIDFLLGLQKRAPMIFQKLGLEWFYRLITQPKIRAKRIWDALYHFPRLIKKSSNI